MQKGGKGTSPTPAGWVKWYLNADFRRLHADGRGFLLDNPRKSACNPRLSALNINLTHPAGVGQA